jgi:hypothetical protein
VAAVKRYDREIGQLEWAAGQDYMFTDLVDNCRRWALTNLVIDRRLGTMGAGISRSCSPKVTRLRR